MAKVTTPTLVVFVNTSITMSAGKVAAQVAHAASQAKKPASWGKGKQDTVLVLAATGDQINNLETYLGKRKIKTHKIIDEGTLGQNVHAVTAMSCDIMDRSEATKLFHSYQPFTKHYTVIQRQTKLSLRATPKVHVSHNNFGLGFWFGIVFAMAVAIGLRVAGAI